MRLACLLATLGLLIAPLRPAAAQRGGGGAPPPKRREPAPRPPAQTQPAPADVPQAPQPKGEAPSIPTGMTAAEAAAPTPETGVVTKINVQGNRRVEADAIRAARSLKQGDTLDKRNLKDALLSARNMGDFKDIKPEAVPVAPPGTGYPVTVPGV